MSVHGGSIARALEEAGAGLRAEPNASSVAAAVVALLSDPVRRQTASAAARRFAAAHVWSRVTAPLLAWCRDARVDAGRLPFPAAPGRSLWKRLQRK